MPDSVYRHAHDDNVQNEARDSLRVKESLDVEAGTARYAPVPPVCDRPALETGSNDKRNGRHGDENEDDPGECPHATLPVEHAEVQADDAHLRESDGDEVDDLEGEDAFCPSNESFRIVFFEVHDMAAYSAYFGHNCKVGRENRTDCQP